VYKNFFGFKERPFKLVPDPVYLYLSQSHEEALAHLAYAVSQGEGFVEIIGEVGTGKTTLCRVFLENLDETVEAAYIFNPRLDAVHLLKAINDEFGIDAAAENAKNLIDTLNAFLLRKKGEGKKIILLIDEAQNLNREVLEQLRLLSNLETTKNKLLQIILVGQPELGETLDSYELRQLGQRITLRCLLTPLTFKETREYITHRLNLASRKPDIFFDRAACRAVYKFSQGIPRLINIACDRALLTAYGRNRRKITGPVARTAIRELTGTDNFKRPASRPGKRIIFAFAVFLPALIMAVLFLREPPPVNLTLQAPAAKLPETGRRNQTQLKPAPEPANSGRAEKLLPPTSQPATVISSGPELELLLRDIDPRSSRRAALLQAMIPWQMDKPVVKQFLDSLDDDPTYFRLTAKQNGLLIRRINADPDLLKKLNLPAIIAVNLPAKDQPLYLTLCKINNEKFLLRGGAHNFLAVDVGLLQKYWSGPAFIPWKNFLDIAGTIPRNAPGDSVITIKMLLRDIGFHKIEINSFYDDQTREAIRVIQKKYGLQDDGIVGSSTKIALYREKQSFPMPRLTIKANRGSGL